MYEQRYIYPHIDHVHFTRDADEIISIFESDMKSGGLTLKGLDYVVKGY